MRGLVLGLSALLAACGGPTLGDITEQELSVTVTGVASRPDVAAIGEAQGGLGISRAFVSASALSLIPCTARASHIVLASLGYDLLTLPAPSERVTTAVSEPCGLPLDIDPAAQNVAEAIAARAS